MQMSGKPHALVALTSQKQTLVLTKQEAGYGHFWRKEKSLPLARILTPYHPACSLTTILTMQSQPQNNYVTESNKIPLIPQ